MHEQLTVGSEDVGNYVRAMCPEEFAAERQLQSQLSMMRKQGAVEVPERDPAFDGTLLRPSQQLGAAETPSGQQLTPAMRALSMVAATPQPAPLASSTRSRSTAAAPAHQSSAPSHAPLPAEPMPTVPSGPVPVAPKSKLPFIIAGLVAFIGLAAAAVLLVPTEKTPPAAPPTVTPVVQAPVDAGPPAVASATLEPAPVKEAPKGEPPAAEPKQAPVVLETVVVDGKVWKVLRKGDVDLVMLDAKDRLREGDRMNLLGEPGEDGKRPIYAHAAVLEVNGSLAKLLFDEDVPLPEKLFAAKDAAPKVLRAPVKVAEAKSPAEPVKATEPVVPAKAPESVKMPEPVKAPEPAPEPMQAAEPGKGAPGSAQLFGKVRLAIPNQAGDRAVILTSDTGFPLTECEVRLPSNVFFRLGRRVIAPKGVQRVAFSDFHRDARPPDPQFRADWAAVYCREGTGYWKTTYDRP